MLGQITLEQARRTHHTEADSPKPLYCFAGVHLPHPFQRLQVTVEKGKTQVFSLLITNKKFLFINFLKKRHVHQWPLRLSPNKRYERKRKIRKKKEKKKETKRKKKRRKRKRKRKEEKKKKKKKKEKTKREAHFLLLHFSFLKRRKFSKPSSLSVRRFRARRFKHHHHRKSSGRCIISF